MSFLGAGPRLQFFSKAGTPALSLVFPGYLGLSADLFSVTISLIMSGELQPHPSINSISWN